MKDAAVFLLFGQSNAVGHGLPMRQEDKIIRPLKNVFGLSRTLNQSFDRRALFWSGYTSFDMNLGETQDDTYSVANCLARLWQDTMDAGVRLPDLYIVHLAVGAQGVTKNYMWYPDRPLRLIPGPLGTADISLCPLAVQILSRLPDSFRRMGKQFEILGLHWRGGEEDTLVPLRTLQCQLMDLYRRMFSQFRQAMGVPMPVVLHRIVCPERMALIDPTGAALERMRYINQVFEKLCETCAQTYLFDAREAPQYNPDIKGHGIFSDVDLVHFTEGVNRWVAQRILEKYIKERLPVVARNVSGAADSIHDADSSLRQQ